ncbi:hypothetical protein SAMN05444369_10189 [Capnocytophaga haemolytica]|uniref:Uncharacterized protein n=1 Tax=Capnocytophaga haemolytica TaxID=45243 RepID=A0AAX2GX45_9FLAO|nr:hypothetical protein [Capnocytophaga haemolytica]SFN62435.1 hypothetical protein SAMN05444369_10189 [Capnocytophaga haemolytica]SNV03736.1 Uncharacterised protein [Capnocytophaga haemolytica]
MRTEDIKQLFEAFEKAAQKQANIEFWSARELQQNKYICLN